MTTVLCEPHLNAGLHLSPGSSGKASRTTQERVGGKLGLTLTVRNEAAFPHSYTLSNKVGLSAVQANLFIQSGGRRVFCSMISINGLNSAFWG